MSKPTPVRDQTVLASATKGRFQKTPARKLSVEGRRGGGVPPQRKVSVPGFLKPSLKHCKLRMLSSVTLNCQVIMIVFFFVYDMSPHHSDQMSQRSQASWVSDSQWDSQSVSDSEKPLYMRSAVQMEIRQITFQPPPLEQTDALWELFSPKIGKFVKTAVLTLGIDILTMSMVKLCS